MTPVPNGVHSKAGGSATVSSPKPAVRGVRPAASGVRPAVSPARPLSAVMPVPQVAHRKAAFESSGQFPNVKVPLQTPVKKSEPAKLSTKWNCSTCGKALGPLSLSKGTGLLLDGTLLCIDCVKAPSRRKTADALTPKMLALIAGGSLALMAATAVFFPGQVLFAVLLTSVASTIVGVIGSALNRFVRIAVIVAGIAATTAASYGVVALREHAAEVKTESLVARESDEVKQDLKNDCALEALRRIEALEFKVKNNRGETTLTPRHVEELNAQLDAWLHQNYGTLTPEERAFLFTLLKKFGSRTSNSTRRVRALKLGEKSIALTIALDPFQEERDPNTSERALDLKNGPQHIAVSATGNVTLDKAHEILRFLLEKQPGLESVALELVDSAGAELVSISADAADLETIQQGDVAPLLKYAGSARELSR